MKIKMKRAYTTEEVFETLKRETDWRGIFFYKALIGGSAIRIPSHYESSTTMDDIESLRDVHSYWDIQISVRKEKMTIINVPIVKQFKRSNGDYTDIKENKDIKKSKIENVVSVCIRLFA